MGRASRGTGPPTWKEVWRDIGSSRRSSRAGASARRRSYRAFQFIMVASRKWFYFGNTDS